MIKDLIICFGIQGALALLLLLAAIFVAFNYIRSNVYHRYLLRALLLAALSCLLAYLASHRVSSIEIDRSVEIKEAVSKQLKLRGGDDKDGFKIASRMHFAEDSPEDKLDLAGIKSAEKQSIYQRAMAEAEEKYEYKKRGKQKRTVAVATNVNSDEAISSIVGPASVEKVEKSGALLMPRNVVESADRLDVALKTSTLLVLMIILCSLIYNYLSKFNLLVGHLVPVPISGWWLDRLFPKSRSVAFVSEDADMLQKTLENIVRKGETFLCFGFPQLPSLKNLQKIPLEKLPLQKITKCLSPRFIKKITVEKNCMPVYEFSQNAKPFSSEFIFENAWFNRACSLLKDASLAEQHFAAFCSFLKNRALATARARRTINLFIDSTLIQVPAEKIAELLTLAKNTNCRLVFVAASRAALPASKYLEEIVEPAQLVLKKDPPTPIDIVSKNLVKIAQAILPVVFNSGKKIISIFILLFVKPGAKRRALAEQRAAERKDREEKANKLAREKGLQKPKAQAAAAAISSENKKVEKRVAPPIKKPGTSQGVDKIASVPSASQKIMAEKKKEEQPHHQPEQVSAQKATLHPERAVSSVQIPLQATATVATRPPADKNVVKDEKNVKKENVVPEVSAPPPQSELKSSQTSEPAGPSEKELPSVPPPLSVLPPVEKPVQKPLTAAEQLKKRKLSLAFEDIASEKTSELKEEKKQSQSALREQSASAQLEKKSESKPDVSSVFKFLCPYCKQKLEAEREWGGMQIDCPICQKKIIIPKPKQ
jgi:hypothetical protein